MKRNHRPRPLAFEQLESKAAPSSILPIPSEASTNAGFAEVATGSGAMHALRVSNCRYETEQILRFITENATGGEQAHRPAARPTDAECAASDAMMREVAVEWNSLFIVSFYTGETEL